MRKSLIALSLVLVAGLLIVGRVGAEDKKGGGVTIGQPAPAFTLTDQDGKSVSLADYSGKIIVLEWFNNECPFVVKHYSAGDMNTLASKYAEKGVVWLAINSTNSADVAANKKIAGDWNISRPVLDDASGATGHLYGAKTTPHMYIVDKEGKLAYQGAIDSVKSADTKDIAGATNYVAAALDELLASQTVSTPETAAYGCSVKYAK